MSRKQVVVPKPKGRGSPLLKFPEGLWLRILSNLDIKSLFDSCALLCHTWLEFVYQLTGKHLSFTGDCKCKQCELQVSQFQKLIASAILKLTLQLACNHCWLSSCPRR